MTSTFDTQNALGELSSLGVKDLKAVEDAAKSFSDTWAGTSKADFITASYDIKSGIASLTDEGVAQFTQFLDKIISSFGALLASASVALIGYTSTMPQPGDECTTGVLVLTIGLTYALPMLGWICTLVAMKFCHLNREEMVAVQKRIAEKKEALKQQKAQ